MDKQQPTDWRPPLPQSTARAVKRAKPDAYKLRAWANIVMLAGLEALAKRGAPELGRRDICGPEGQHFEPKDA